MVIRDTAELPILNMITTTLMPETTSKDVNVGNTTTVLKTETTTVGNNINETTLSSSISNLHDYFNEI